QNSKLTIPMSLLPLPGSGDGHPEFPAEKKLVILVHGLCDSPSVWSYPENENETYGTRLQEDLNYRPLYLKYNSGLHISTNGKQLARLLRHSLDATGNEIEEIVFIAHSMGGLVVRS